ncbi:unnamed protein product [Diamesa serratosioi]
MKLLFVCVLLLFGDIQGDSDVKFECPEFCTCSPSHDEINCINDNFEVKVLISNDSHLSIECSNSENQWYQYIPHINIIALAITKCNLKEHFSGDDNPTIRKLYIESVDVIQMEPKYLKRFLNLDDLEVVIDSNSTEALEFDFGIITQLKLKNITLINKGARRDLTFKVSFSATFNKLSCLKIRGFNLKKLHSESFKWLFRTEKLELSDNSLEFEEWGFETFSDFGKTLTNKDLKELVIEHNDIIGGILPGQLLYSVTSLQIVSLDYNNLESIPEELFNKTNVIRKLSMKHNALTVIPSNLPKSVVELDFSCNQIENVIEREIQGLTMLKILRLSNNKIKEILRTKLSLKELDLDGNQISNGDSNIAIEIPSMFNLETLNLRNNTISKITLNKMNWTNLVPKTSTVDLRDNNITYDILLTETVAHNNITLLMDFFQYQKMCEANNIKTLQNILKQVHFSNIKYDPPQKLEFLLVDETMTDLICPPNGCPIKCECTIIKKKYFIGCSNSSLTVFPAFHEDLSSYRIIMDLRFNNITRLPNNLNDRTIYKILASQNQIKQVDSSNIPHKLKLFNLTNNPVEKTDVHVEALKKSGQVLIDTLINLATETAVQSTTVKIEPKPAVTTPGTDLVVKSDFLSATTITCLVITTIIILAAIAFLSYKFSPLMAK